MADKAALLKMLGSETKGVLATLMPDGRPHLSTVGHHFDESRSIIRVSLAEDRVKIRNLRLDPRATYHVSTDDRWSWAAAEGVAELSPTAADPNDDTVEDLIDLYRILAGEHPDWDDFRRAMVEERRIMFKLHVERVYGMARG